MKTYLLAAALLASTPSFAAPTAISVNRQPETTLVVSGASTVFRVTFSESVTGVDTTDFNLLKVGTVTGTVASISGSGASYDVTVNGISGFGTLRLDLKHTGTGIVDGASNALADGFDNGQVARVGTAAAIGWGSHAVGQIGDGTAAGGSKNLPTAVDATGAISGKNVVQLASGSNFTIALTADNLLFAWGSNTNGQFGNGTTSVTPITSPVAIPMTGVLSGKTIIQIACGDSFVMALDSTGQIYAWGVGTSGQLGDGLSTTGGTPVAVSTSGALNGKVVTRISAGATYAAACTSDGGLYTWGGAASGRLGNGTTTGNVTTPAQLGGVFTGKRVVAVSCGGSFGAALTSDGLIYTWGANTQGQLGDGGGTLGTPANNPTPAGISGTGLLPGSRKAASVTGTNSGMYAIARDGTLYSWGSGTSGGLGNGGTTSSTSPVLVTTSGLLSGKTIAFITGGNNFAHVLTTEGKQYSWGANASGQLGDGGTTQQNSPIAVDVGASSALNGRTVSFLSSSTQPTFAMSAASAAAPVATAPTVTTATQSAITHNSATLGGNVTADGGASVTERGIVWGTSTGPTTANNKVQNGSGTGVFSGTVNSLPAGTTVFVRAYAINSVNTSYGNEISFNTLPAPVAISSLNRADVSPNRTGTVNWTLTFASAVSGVSASNFSLTGAAATGATVGSPTTGNGGLAWNVPVTTGSTDGTLTLNLANSTGISPGISTALPYAGQSYTMDKTAPTISIGSPSVSSIAAGAGSVTYTVTYADANFNASTLANGNITLNTTGTASGTVGVSGSGTTRTVTISSITGAGTLGISIASGTATDTAGNIAAAAGPSTTFTVTAPAPLVTSVSSLNANTAYRAGELVSIQVNFNTSVTVTGNPTLALNSGGTAAYSFGGPGTTLNFNYAVGAGQTASDLDYSATNSLALAGGTINATTGGTAATLTLPSPGAAGSLGANKAIVIDTTAPTIGISSPSVSSIAAGAGSVTYTVTYADTNFNSSTLANGNITLNTTGTANGLVNVTGSGLTRTVTISSITGAGTLGISIASGTASDTAGNAAAAAGPSTTFAVTAPALPDYAITTVAGVLTITDNSGNADTLVLSEPSVGNILFTTTGRTFSLNGAASTSNNSGNISLAGITSIVVNAADGGDTINVAAFTTVGGFPSLTLNGGTDDDAVNLNGDITFATNASLDVDLQNDDAAPGADRVTLANNANVVATGTGSITVKASRNVLLNAGSSLDTVNGNLTLEGNQQVTPTTGNFYGVRLNAATARVTGTGALSVSGKGGDDAIGSQYGVFLSNTPALLQGGTSGTVTVRGTGGASSGDSNDGVVFVGATAPVTTTGSNVQIFGFGGGTGASTANLGIDVGSGVQITAGGSGDVLVQGTGGAVATGQNHGIRISGLVTSGGGDVTVAGLGGGSGAAGSNYGVSMNPGHVAAGGSGTPHPPGHGRRGLRQCQQWLGHQQRQHRHRQWRRRAADGHPRRWGVPCQH